MNELLEMMGNLKECPWVQWAPATLKFCEAHLCEWIVAPAETWSNLAYFIVALWLYIQKEKRFAFYALMVAIFSSLFHASYTYAFETADLAAMNFLGVEMVVQGLRRLGWLKGTPIPFAAILFVAGFLLLVGTSGMDRLLVFAAFAAVAVWLESLAYLRGRRAPTAVIGPPRSYSAALQSLALFAVAFTFWALDSVSGVCDPDRHWFSGHAAWHVVNSGCFLTLSRFYRPR